MTVTKGQRQAQQRVSDCTEPGDPLNAGAIVARATAAARPTRDLADLRRRIEATRWPDRETVSDRSQGAQLAELDELVRYWDTDYELAEGRGATECL
jgi:hypothetical protein